MQQCELNAVINFIVKKQGGLGVEGVGCSVCDSFATRDGVCLLSAPSLTAAACRTQLEAETRRVLTAGPV